MAPVSDRLLSLPLSAASNPHAAQVQHELEDWVVRAGLVRNRVTARRASVAEVGMYAGSIQPEAPYARLLVYAKLLTWMFLVNDQYGQGIYRTPEAWRLAVAPLYPILRHTGARASVSASPAARALIEILGEIYPGMSAAWRQRFADGVWRGFVAVGVESRDRRQGRTPRLDEYLRNRSATSMGAPLIELFRFTAGVELPPELTVSRPYRELVCAATDVMAWINDIASLEREEAAGEVHNLVMVLRDAGDMSREDAIAAVEDRILARIDDCAAYKGAIRRDFTANAPSPADRKIIDHLFRSIDYWITGNIRFAATSPRYRISSGGKESRPDEIADILLCGSCSESAR
ncbi:terpene synthase family protein [Nocardia blacklockiae]|uniref:terpene synthase family protein n=1 Tax=Nocardia blacklockiae TaxID=480036 RepID=UPI001892D47F|nr:terpene synthase family protein [Nocardia blacklockiae]MBF6176588.1 hypothetical protein [Nocardia blacklockiae]